MTSCQRTVKSWAIRGLPAKPSLTSKAHSHEHNAFKSTRPDDQRASTGGVFTIGLPLHRRRSAFVFSRRAAVNQTPRRGVGSPANAVDAGKTGDGAGGAMAQIARDRVVASAGAEPHITNEHIKALWRLRVPEDRTLDGLWTLQTWLAQNAPEVFRDKGDSFKYLLALLSNEMTPGGGSE
jgi:hypothetical protein